MHYISMNNNNNEQNNSVFVFLTRTELAEQPWRSLGYFLKDFGAFTENTGRLLSSADLLTKPELVPLPQKLNNACRQQCLILRLSLNLC